MENKITLIFDDDALKEIEEIKDKLHLKSNLEVFKRGLKLLQFATEQEEKGDGILYVKDNGLWKMSVF